MDFVAQAVIDWRTEDRAIVTDARFVAVEQAALMRLKTSGDAYAKCED